MTEKRLTRRDWFRLKAPQQNRMLTSGNSDQATGAEPVASLKPMELPPNHDGLDMKELPPMNEAELSWDQVGELVEDIQNLTEDILLMQRSSGSPGTTASRLNSREQLTAAASALESGRVSRIQVRYRWEGAQWIDTIERREAAFRLVRIRHAIR